jgi:hypothetical protein
MECSRDGCTETFIQNTPWHRYCSRDCQVQARENGPNMLHVRLKPDQTVRLRDEAAARDVSMNWLVGQAVAEFLDRLAPFEDTPHLTR